MKLDLTRCPQKDIKNIKLKKQMKGSVTMSLFDASKK